MLRNLNTRFYIFCSRRPWLYFSIYKYHVYLKNLLVRQESDLVIEGFPRSANTFAAFALQSANPEVSVCYHTHASAQVIRGVELGIPTLILIRHPIDAVKSLMLREPAVTPIMAFQLYTAFYTDIYPLRDSFIVAQFEQVTSDFGDVVARINNRFNTDFLPFEHSEEAVTEVFHKIDMGYKHLGRGKMDVSKVARPNQEKETLKGRVSLPVEHRLIEQSSLIYKQYVDLSKR